MCVLDGNSVPLQLRPLTCNIKSLIFTYVTVVSEGDNDVDPYSAIPTSSDLCV